MKEKRLASFARKKTKSYQSPLQKREDDFNDWKKRVFHREKKDSSEKEDKSSGIRDIR